MMPIAQSTDLRAALAVGHGVEADQDVRQAGGAEHQREAERDAGRACCSRSARCRRLDAVAQARVRGTPSPLPRLRRRPSPSSAERLKLYLRQHQDRHQQRAGHQQDGLDDLHPGGALHAADGHVDDHQRADEDDRGDLRGVGVHAEERRARLDAEQQRDQRARADHLGEQVEDRHDDGGDAPPPCGPGAGASGTPARRPSCTGRSCAAARRPAAARPARRPGSRSSRGSRRSRRAR